MYSTQFGAVSALNPAERLWAELQFAGAIASLQGIGEGEKILAKEICHDPHGSTVR